MTNKARTATVVTAMGATCVSTGLFVVAVLRHKPVLGVLSFVLGVVAAFIAVTFAERRK